MIDLKNHTLAELRDLQAQVAQQIKTREKDEIAKVRQRILELAQSVGMPLDQLMKGAQDRKPTKTVAARYQHPDDPKQQWTGRGRQPRWVKEYLEKPDNKLESLLIG
jgi:DNA-binding protein H-NS